ncbi:hypothetical protein AAHC03_0117 [Spirometra sp. Aus1]
MQGIERNYPLGIRGLASYVDDSSCLTITKMTACPTRAAHYNITSLACTSGSLPIDQSHLCKRPNHLLGQLRCALALDTLTPAQVTIGGLPFSLAGV